MTDLCAGPVGRPSTHPGAGSGPGPLIYHETVTYRHRSTPVTILIAHFAIFLIVSGALGGSQL